MGGFDPDLELIVILFLSKSLYSISFVCLLDLGLRLMTKTGSGLECGDKPLRGFFRRGLYGRQP